MGNVSVCSGTLEPETKGNNMKTIWKYPLEVTDEQQILMPTSAQVLSVQLQQGSPCLWALVDPVEPLTLHTFMIHGTGHPCECGASEYIGTFQQRNGLLVFHVFEVGRKA